MKRLFGEVYAPSTLGSFPRSFTHGHVQQLVVVLRAMLVSLAAKTQVLAGADQMTFVDIDSLLRRVYGSKKRGAVRAGQGRRLSTLTARSVAIWWPRSPRHGRLR
jgi:hypothetical protein